MGLPHLLRFVAAPPLSRRAVAVVAISTNGRGGWCGDGMRACTALASTSTSTGTSTSISNIAIAIASEISVSLSTSLSLSLSAGISISLSIGDDV